MTFALILLSLVAVTYGARQSCDGNCRMPPPEQIQTTSRPHCKCLEKYIEWLKANKLQEKLYKKPKDSIFYELAENEFRNEYSKVGYPLFFSSNLDRTSYYHKNQMPKNIPSNSAYQSYTFEVPDSTIRNISPKIKRKNYDRDITNKTNYSPLYLDIYIKQEDKDGQITQFVTDMLDTKQKELIEKDFKDCLDLHAIIYSRNSTDIMIEGMLSERNKIYNKLPNSDIIIELKKKCSQLANIITEGIKEINNKRLFKKHNVFSDNEYSFNSYGRSNFQDEVKDLKTTTTTAIYQRNISSIEYSTPVIYNEEGNDNIERATTTEFKKDISSVTIAENSDFLSATFFEETIDPITEIGEKSTTLGYSQQTIPMSVQDVDINLLTTHTELLTNTTTVSSINDDDNITADSTVSKEEISTAPIANFYYYDKVKGAVVDTAYEKNSDDIQNQEFSTVSDVFLKLSGVHRPSYLEGEYEIPKLVTTEFSNETVKSELEGNEEIPNLDFINKSDDIITLGGNTDTVITTVGQWEVSNEDSTKYPMQNENFSVSEERTNNGKNSTGSTNLDISGELYFKHGSDYVPATFIQKPDGQVKVALNIISLCHTNKREITSKLIQAICNCVSLK